MAEEDKESRAIAQIKVEGQQIIAMIEEALKIDKSLLNQGELDGIRNIMSELAEALESADRNAIEEKIKRLNEGTANFAAKRMDNSISKALSGKNIDTLEL